MGRSIAITYTVQIFVSGKFHTPSEWRTRARLNGVVPAHGKPTAENLAKYIAGYEESTRGDGCNKHLGELTVEKAHIVHQPSGTVVASYPTSEGGQFGERLQQANARGWADSISGWSRQS